MRNIALLFLIFINTDGLSQKKVTVEDFTTRNTFSSNSFTGISWMKDGKFYSSLRDNRIIRFDVTTGPPVEIIVDGNQLLL